MMRLDQALNQQKIHKAKDESAALNRALGVVVVEKPWNWMDTASVLFTVFVIGLVITAIVQMQPHMCMGKGCTPQAVLEKGPDAIAKWKVEQAIRDAEYDSKPNLKKILNGE